jgi:lipid-A-disaccharide synthase
MEKKIYIVAGEPSGDLLGAKLMSAIIKRNPNISIAGVGGEAMTAMGLKSLFNIVDIAVMGFAEVVPKMPLIFRRLKETAKDIERYNPDLLITIDSWGFVHQLLARLHKNCPNLKKLHYVAPQVWAWKKGRTKTAAKIFDALMTLLPNEPQYFERHALKTYFVGHPVAEYAESVTTHDNNAFRNKYNIGAHETILCLLPGSRNSEIKRLAPVFKRVVSEVQKVFPHLFIVIPSVTAMETNVKSAFADCPIPHCVVLGQEERYSAFAASAAALASSGTVTLELAACGTPHVVAYKFGFISSIIINIMVRPHLFSANLVNILLHKRVIDECLMECCCTSYILPRLLDIMQDTNKRQSQIDDAKKALRLLLPEGMLPSEKAADVVFSILRENKHNS